MRGSLSEYVNTDIKAREPPTHALYQALTTYFRLSFPVNLVVHSLEILHLYFSTNTITIPLVVTALPA